jgi:poly-beta-1,6-N-acetyl-D-glucosamine synthase
MRGLEIVFWFCIIIIIYTYIGYGIIVWLINKLKGLFSNKMSKTSTQGFLPEVALIIAAYNEQDYIEKKYPWVKLPLR